MIKVGDEILTPPKPKIDFWSKRGSKNPKSAQNPTKLDWAKIFRVVQAQQMNKVDDGKFYPPLVKIGFLAKKWGHTTQNWPETQPSQIELKFSG